MCLGLAACADEPSGAASAPVSSAPAVQALHPSLEAVFERIGRDEFDAALADLDALVTDDAAPVVRYQGEFLRGFVFHRQKLYSRAREHFERAIALQPDYHPPHHFLGFAAYYLGDLERARAAFERHLELRPDEGDDHFGIGLCDLDEGRLDAAYERFVTAIRLHREAQARGADRRRRIGAAYARIGDVEDLRGDLRAARSAYDQALLAWPPHHEVWAKLHRVLTRLGEDELAEIAREQHEAWAAHARGEEP